MGSYKSLWIYELPKLQLFPKQNSVPHLPRKAFHSALWLMATLESFSENMRASSDTACKLGPFFFIKKYIYIFDYKLDTEIHTQPDGLF